MGPPSIYKVMPPCLGDLGGGGSKVKVRPFILRQLDGHRVNQRVFGSNPTTGWAIVSIVLRNCCLEEEEA